MQNSIDQKQAIERVSANVETTPRTLKQVADAVAEDARREPEDYLAETEVPYGGE